MSKKFNETKFGHFLTKTLTGKIIIGAGDFFTGGTVSNIVENTDDSPSGSIDKIKALGVILTGLILIYLVVSGKISLEDAENLKELVE